MTARVTEWFGLDRTLKIISSHPPAMSRVTSTRWSNSELQPTFVAEVNHSKVRHTLYQGALRNAEKHQSPFTWGAMEPPSLGEMMASSVWKSLMQTFTGVRRKIDCHFTISTIPLDLLHTTKRARWKAKFRNFPFRYTALGSLKHHVQHPPWVWDGKNPFFPTGWFPLWTKNKM